MRRGAARALLLTAAVAAAAAGNATCDECAFGTMDSAGGGGRVWDVRCPTPYPAPQRGFSIAGCIARHAGVSRGAVATVTVDLRSTPAAAVPLGLFDGLNEWLIPRAVLTVRAPAASTLPAGFFGGAAALPSVVAVDLSGNALEALPAALLEPCPAVEELSVDRNRLRSLPGALLAPLRGLRFLWAMGNAVAAVDPGAFAGLPRLEQVYLHDNPLRTLPAAVEFADARALRVLTLPGRLSLTQGYAPVFERVRTMPAISLTMFAGVYCSSPMDVFPPYEGPQTYEQMMQSCSFAFAQQ